MCPCGVSLERERHSMIICVQLHCGDHNQQKRKPHINFSYFKTLQDRFYSHFIKSAHAVPVLPELQHWNLQKAEKLKEKSLYGEEAVGGWGKTDAHPCRKETDPSVIPGSFLPPTGIWRKITSRQQLFPHRIVRDQTTQVIYISRGYLWF